MNKVMIHGINNEYLYAVTKLVIHISNGKDRITSQGTGFWISKGDDCFLITNRHVIEPGWKDSKYSSYTQIESISFDCRHFDEVNKDVKCASYTMNSYSLVFSSNGIDDIACIYDVVVSNFKDELTFIPFSMLATSEQYGNELSVCDHVAFIGFPIVYDHKHNMPVLRSGYISSDPRLDYSPDGKNNGHIVAYEAFSTEGASGSPAFATQRGFKVGKGINAPDGFYRPPLLIGINAGSYSVSNTHQHMSYMFKSDQIIDLITLAKPK